MSEEIIMRIQIQVTRDKAGPTSIEEIPEIGMSQQQAETLRMLHNEIMERNNKGQVVLAIIEVRSSTERLPIIVRETTLEALA